MHEDRFVEAHDGIRLAVRDHRGEGRDLVMLHGAGSHLLALFNLVRKFQNDFRVVTVDARWSGQSGDSDEYAWSDLVADVEAVVSQLGLDNPIVGGHSWGGMIAAHYGAAHPDAPAVVNIDGHGSGNPSLYDGMAEEEVVRSREAMAALNTDAPGSAEGDDGWRVEARVEARAMNELLGVPPELVDEWTDRNFVEVAPGRWRRHPSRLLFEGLRRDLDLFALYRRVECPLQIFNCTAPGGVQPGFEEMFAAYRRGLTKALDTLAAERANVDVVTLPDANHNGVLARGASRAAAEIRRFVDAAS